MLHVAPDNPILDAALSYAARGWAVFPCNPSPEKGRAKQPLMPREKDADGKPIPKTGGFYKATTDPDTIRAWWAKWPRALIGVPMGRGSGVFAIDPDAPKVPGDPDGVAAWEALQAEIGGVPATHTHLTPNGGRHLLFRYPDGRTITNREGRLPAGINVRGEGGYVIAPPSRLLDGRAWAIEEPEHAFDFADAPHALLEIIDPPPEVPRVEPLRNGGSRHYAEDLSDRYVAAAVEHECAAIAAAPRGGRNNTLNRAGFSLGQLVGSGALGANEATRCLFDAATASGLVAEDGRGTVLATIESGLTAGAQKPREVPERQRPERVRKAPDRRGPEVEREFDEPDEEPDWTDKPIIRVVASELPRVVDEAEHALMQARLPIFTRAENLVEPIQDQVAIDRRRVTMVARLRTLPPAALTDQLAQVARFQRYDERRKDWVNIDPPPKVAETLLAREGHWRLPSVAGVVTTPCLRPDGTLLDRPGYDPPTRLYLMLDRTFRLPPLSERPSRAAAVRARDLLLEVLDEFPFVGAVDRAVALSGILTTVTRTALPAAPAHVIRAHAAGTGKSYLVDLFSAIAAGRPCSVMAVGRTEEETEKRLGALLLAGVPIISLDNINGELGGDALCQMTERPLVRVRILGESKAPELECRATIFATGNNITLVGDMTRRAVLCTLDAGVERPELRSFNLDPIERVLADRGTYVAAAITIVRAYRAAGSPPVCGPIGSYGPWSETVRAPLIWLGEADPVTSMEAVRDEDPELGTIREFFARWREHLFESAPYTSSTIIGAASERDPNGELVRPEFHELLLRIAGRGPQIEPRRLGKWLSKIKGRIVDGLKLEMRPDRSNGSRFTLRAAGAE